MEPEGDYSRQLAPYWRHKSTAGSPSSPPLSPKPSSPSMQEHAPSSDLSYTYDAHSENPNNGSIISQSFASQSPTTAQPNDVPCSLSSSLFIPSSTAQIVEEEPYRETELLVQQLQEEEDYAYARKLMDQSSVAPTETEQQAQTTHSNTAAGKALAFVHAIREAVEQNADDEMRMVSMVDGTLIHATTERLLKLQKQIMHKNDHLFNKHFDLLPQLYNSDDEDEEELEGEDNGDVENERSNEIQGNGESHGDQFFAAAQAEASELIDVCYGACDVSGSIKKLPCPATFGQGVYTSNTPFSPIFFPQPTETKRKLLLMARLKGKTEYIHPSNTTGSAMRGQTDSAILVTPGTADEICILRKSSQCIPIFFIRQNVPGSGRPVLDYDDDNAVGNDIIHRHVCLLQRLIDQLLLDKDRHSPSIPQRVLPSEVKGVSEQLEISSFQVANRSLASSMKHWSLRTVAYYTCPETIDDRAFCIYSAAQLEHYLTNESSGNSKQASKCTLCSTKGGNVKALPCRHAFHVPCLFSRLSKGKLHCPTCNVPVQYRQTALLDQVQKDPALIVNFSIGEPPPEEPKNTAHHHCQSPTSVLTAMIPVLSDVVSPMAAENALTIKYDCGASFKLKLSAPPIRRTTTVAEQWSKQFHDPIFLSQIQGKVKAHSGRCAVCQRQQEGRPRSNLLRYIVPRHSSNTDNDAQSKVLIGTMPSGTMRVDEFPGLLCSGHSPGIFSIKYQFDEGVQKEYHQNPGELYRATLHEAFLPNSPQGRLLLERLIIAFTYGLTFTIENSAAGRKGNAISWSTIPHKTSLSPGSNGYPDLSYFDAAHAELDSLGVPRVPESPQFQVD